MPGDPFEKVTPMSTALDYAPPTPFYKRRLFRRGLLLAILTLAFAITAYLGRHWIRDRYLRTMLIQAQKSCLNYQPRLASSWLSSSLRVSSDCMAAPRPSDACATRTASR